MDKSLLPTSESLKDMEQRLTPFWHEEIVPEILVNINVYFNKLFIFYEYLNKFKLNKKVLIVAHGIYSYFLSSHHFLVLFCRKSSLLIRTGHKR